MQCFLPPILTGAARLVFDCGRVFEAAEAYETTERSRLVAGGGIRLASLRQQAVGLGCLWE